MDTAIARDVQPSRAGTSQRNESFGPEEFQRVTGVSRETLTRLERYVGLLERWQATINLVSRSSLQDIWNRHILDSAQLHAFVPASARVLLDLGSGAGFPGLVLAVLGVPKVYLVESDARKCAFLIEAARITGMQLERQVHVRSSRIEALRVPVPVDVITSRALGALDGLLDYAEPFLGPGTVCIFSKGRTVEDELTTAFKTWNMRVDRTPSRTDSTGIILRLSNVQRRTDR